MKLSEMTLEELWELFPIFLTPHNDAWAGYFADEYALLSEMPSLSGATISHIGSTAVKAIAAKPIIDILAELPDGSGMSLACHELQSGGYTLMCKSEARMDFNKGYTENGFANRVYHLHLRFAGDNDELYFRDYMIYCASAAKEYESLKLSLWHRYEHNRDAYTEAKGEFVRKYTELAKREFGARYLR